MLGYCSKFLSWTLLFCLINIDTHAVDFYETRALFAHECAGATAAEIKETITRMQKANMNVILVQILKGYAFWDSAIALPYQRPLKFDPLAYLVQHAHAAGIEVHGICDCFYLSRPEYIVSGAPDDPYVKFEKFVLYRSQQAPALEQACPHDEQYRQFFVSAVEEACRKYALDGVNLDLVRTRGKVCLCADCCRKYRAKFGRDLLQDATHYSPELQAWQEAGVSALVQATAEAVHAINTNIVISICAYVPSLNVDLLQGQTPQLWSRRGWLDAVFPMVYKPNADYVVTKTKQYQEAMPTPAMVYPLIAPCYADTIKAIDPFLKLFADVRSRCEIHGVGLYYHRFLTDDLATALRKDFFQTPARPFWRKE